MLPTRMVMAIGVVLVGMGCEATHAQVRIARIRAGVKRAGARIVSNG